MLLVAEEMEAELNSKEELKLNAKQRAWLKRQQEKEERSLQRKMRAAERERVFLQANPEIAAKRARFNAEILAGLTPEQLQKIRFVQEKRMAEKEANRKALYAKVLKQNLPSSKE